MKKFYLALTAILFCFIANAQYFYLPFTNPGQNPGGVNNDAEYPVGGGLPAGWTTISAATNAVPVWGATQTIPFPFMFNGAAVTQFKVSSSAILTFDVSTAVAAPTYTKAALPSALIPDNSVCIWGLASLGTNDYVISKTFGTAPNRQLWIQFNSYGYGTAPSSGSAYTYWSIVLEEITNKIYIVDSRTGGYAATKKVSAGIQINSTTAYDVAGSPDLLSIAGTNATSIDNKYYEFIYGTQAANEAQLTSLTNLQYFIIPASTNITGSITNLGSQPITTLDIKYDVGGTVYTDTKTGLNIATFQSYNFTHSTAVNIPSPTAYPVKVWVDLAGDANHINDTLNTNVYGLTFLPTKHVVFEEATGTWCGWCPRGAVFMDSLAVLHPTTAMLIAVHNGTNDPMVVANYDAGMGPLIGGYPSGLVDRKDLDKDPNTFIAEYNLRINDVPPADISVFANFNPVTRDLIINVNALIATDLAGDYRLNAVVVEDNITGITSGYNQVNYYSFQSNDIPLQGAGHNWQLEPNPVPAINMEYDHVGRAILGGFNSQVGSLPAAMSANSTYSYTFNYNIPVTYNEANIHVIGWIADGTLGHILNAGRGDLVTRITENSSQNTSVSVYPNPATDALYLTLSLKEQQNVIIIVSDMLGKQYFSQNLGIVAAGNHKMFNNISDLSSGSYLITIQTGNDVITKKFVK